MSHGLLDGQSQHAYYNGDEFGGYQFISLDEVIDNFTATYVGEGKLLQKTLSSDISFHAHRALQELSYDTLKSCKAQEIEVSASLTMPLPHDYVNYVKLVWSDSAGIEHIIYPTSKTSNPKAIHQDADGKYQLTAVGTLTDGSDTIVLNGEYSNISVGMQVIGASIPQGSSLNTIMGASSTTLIKEISTTGGITTIVLGDEVGLRVEAIWSGDELLEFRDTSYPRFGALGTLGGQAVDVVPTGELIEQRVSSFIIEGFSWDLNVSYNKITASSAAAIANVKVGMIASHEHFTVQTPGAGGIAGASRTGVRVADIQGASITLEWPGVSRLQRGATNADVTFIDDGNISDTWSKYKSNVPSENNNDDYEDDTYWPVDGSRFGLDPQHAQVNGSYYIDCANGVIHFSSNLAGKTVTLKYISDHLGTHEEIVVPKLAEEAMYKWIAYGCLSARVDIPEYVINRYKKEKFAETRKAKLRLSNIKLEEITQILRGKSKQIKH